MESITDNHNEKYEDPLVLVYNELKQRKDLYSQQYLRYREFQYHDCKTGILSLHKNPFNAI